MSESSENSYYKKALSDFVGDVASAGAIRHLADLGYSAEQIGPMLDFPTPMEKIREVIYKHFVDTGVIREKEPASGDEIVSVEYKREYDKYGRQSFKRIVTKSVEERSYLKCEFGKKKYQDPAGYEDFLDRLKPEDRSYIEGIPWPLAPVWHVEDERMKRILNNYK